LTRRSGSNVNAPRAHTNCPAIEGRATLARIWGSISAQIEPLALAGWRGYLCRCRRRRYIVSTSALELAAAAAAILLAGHYFSLQS